MTEYHLDTFWVSLSGTTGALYETNPQIITEGRAMFSQLSTADVYRHYYSPDGAFLFDINNHSLLKLNLTLSVYVGKILNDFSKDDPVSTSRPPTTGHKQLRRHPTQPRP